MRRRCIPRQTLSKEHMGKGRCLHNFGYLLSDLPGNETTHHVTGNDAPNTAIGLTQRGHAAQPCHVYDLIGHYCPNKVLTTRLMRAVSTSLSNKGRKWSAVIPDRAAHHYGCDRAQL